MRVECTVGIVNIAVNKDAMKKKTLKQPKRFCMHCGGVLNGRADQKFCDLWCRSSYHNAERRSMAAEPMKLMPPYKQTSTPTRLPGR